MTIKHPVIIGGGRESVQVSATIDTGADVTLIPEDVAVRVGAWRTDRVMSATPAFGEDRVLNIVLISIHFPRLDGRGGHFDAAVGEAGSEILIGMNVLRHLGIEVDPRSGKIAIPNRVWEAIKTVTTVGALGTVGVLALASLFDGDDKPSPRKSSGRKPAGHPSDTKRGGSSRRKR